MLSYRVSGIPPGEKLRQVLLTFDESGWQWALKLRAFLKRRGWRKVRLDEKTLDEEETNDGK